MGKITNASTGQSANASAGDSFRELAQNEGLGIPFGCENGLCGTCLVTINSGMDNLSPHSEQEEFTLEARSAEDDQRLICQCQITGEGDIEFEQ